tara:strand:- start:2760 stop:4043 length:1284 start_codon:yes stop_codon:yes gene_type:complete
MTGGLLQLVAYGAQDVYLTGNPQITFFKTVYRRHTNFAIESIQQTINGSPDYGKRVTIPISRNGDLIHKILFEITLPRLTDPEQVGFDILSDNYDRYVNYVGLRLLDTVEIEIGGQLIDRQYSSWMYIWNELTLSIGKKHGFQDMIGADSDLTSFKESTLYVPLEFWFCRNIGLALPLIALQYHEVKLNITFGSWKNCTYNGTAYVFDSDVSGSIIPIKNVSCWVDYIYLDTDERRRFAQLSHEYLIEQLQSSGTHNVSSNSAKISLSFNHPVKELVWYLNSDDLSSFTNQWYNFTDSSNIVDMGNEGSIDLQSNIFGIDPDGNNPFETTLLQLNGNDRFAQRDGKYFSLVQPYQHHTNIPSNSGINVYSFALKPEEHQPSGTLNMSRIDTATLSVKSSKTGTINVYATNYNVLRILSGMGGLAFSN